MHTTCIVFIYFIYLLLARVFRCTNITCLIFELFFPLNLSALLFQCHYTYTGFPYSRDTYFKQQRYTNIPNELYLYLAVYLNFEINYVLSYLCYDMNMIIYNIFIIPHFNTFCNITNFVNIFYFYRPSSIYELIFIFLPSSYYSVLYIFSHFKIND